MNKQDYDNLMNEGGEGYNPIRHAKITPVESRTEADVAHEIEILDSSVARESGTYNPEKIATLRAELADMEQAREDKFRAEWTAEVTAARRAEWNSFISSFDGTVNMMDVGKRERQQGWSMDALKKAIEMHK